MDIHTVDSNEFSAEEVVKAHMEDLAIQDQFGVKQLKYWVNEQAKTIFCLMEGPNKEACNQVHLQSHGNTACNIIEVSDNEYNLFMGVGNDVNDLAQTQTGELDTGYRTILLTNIVCFSKNEKVYFEEISLLIDENNGIIVREPDNQIMISFIYASEAISCGESIRRFINSKKDVIEFNLAVVSGKPVDEDGDSFFEETKAKAYGLCFLGLNQAIYLDHETQLLSTKESKQPIKKLNNFTLVNNEALKFSLELSQIINKNFIRTTFNSKDLVNRLGLSKSQTYRKIKSLTGFAPNQLIQEFKLQKALNNLSESNKTIAEIAYESGYNSPTYFTRVFKKRFSISPSEFQGIKH